MQVIRTSLLSSAIRFIVLLGCLLVLVDSRIVVKTPAAAQGNSSEAYFLAQSEYQFVIRLTDPARIQFARDIVAGKVKVQHLRGIPVHESIRYNVPWNLYLKPETISFSEGLTTFDNGALWTAENVSRNDDKFPFTLFRAILIGVDSLKEITPSFTPETLVSVSAASYQRSKLAPGAIAAAFGNGLAAQSVAASSSILPMSLAGTSVRVKDSQGAERLAPLFFVSPAQINYLIPKETAPGLARIEVLSDNTVIASEDTQVMPFAANLFTVEASGQGLPAALVYRQKPDQTFSYEPVATLNEVSGKFEPIPIDFGDEGDELFLALFGTGLDTIDGTKVFAGAALRGQQPRYADVTYAGAQGGYAGLSQINVRLPRELKGSGEHQLWVMIGGQATNGVRVVFK